MEGALDLKPVRSRSRAEHLADDITGSLKAAGLRPGERVGTLEELRARTGYARTTVSEAVRLLRERGVLEIRPGRGGGLFLAEDSAGVVVRMRRTLLDVEGSSDRAVAEAIELREALEEAVARQAARHCGPEDAVRLRKLAGQLAAAGADYQLFLRRNWVLHEALLELCHSSMLKAVYGSCLGYLRQGRARYGEQGSPAGYVRERAQVHHDLVEAVIADDPDRIRWAVDRHNRPPDPHDGEADR